MNIDTLDTLDTNNFNIDKMISNHGFFYYPVENKDNVNNMMETVKKYFDLPLEKKMLQPHNTMGLGYIPMNRVRRGVTITKESYTYIPNKIISPFEDNFNNYYNMMENIAKKIFIEIMNNLHINKNKYSDMIDNSTATLSILHYPAIEMKKQMIGISPHTDWGLLTILYTDNNGLQVNINNKWINIPYKKDHFIINIADMIEIITNGKYKSTIHRVINTNEKYSIAYFYEPPKDYIIKPLIENEIIKYKSVKYSMYHGDKIKISTNMLL